MAILTLTTFSCKVLNGFIFAVSRGTCSAYSKVRLLNILHSCFIRMKNYLYSNILADVGTGSLRTSNMELSVTIVINL